MYIALVHFYWPFFMYIWNDHLWPFKLTILTHHSRGYINMYIALVHFYWPLRMYILNDHFWTPLLSCIKKELNMADYFTKNLEPTRHQYFIPFIVKPTIWQLKQRVCWNYFMEDLQSTNHHLDNLQPIAGLRQWHQITSNGNYHVPIKHTKTTTITTTH